MAARSAGPGWPPRVPADAEEAPSIVTLHRRAELAPGVGVEFEFGPGNPPRLAVVWEGIRERERLTPTMLIRYRAARDAFLSEVAEALGGSLLVVEPVAGDRRGFRAQMEFDFEGVKG